MSIKKLQESAEKTQFDQKASVSPPTEDQLRLELNDTTDPIQVVAIKEKLLAHSRHQLDQQIRELFNAYNKYTDCMVDLFNSVHNKNK